MSITIQEPIKTVNGILTKALATLSQLLYGVQRVDYTQCRSEANSGVMRIIIPIDGVNPSALADVQTGTVLYYNAVDTSLSGIYTVTTIFVSGATTEIRCNTETPYAGAASTGTVNNISARPSYRLVVDIFEADGTRMFQSSFQYVPNQSGFININVGSLVTVDLKNPATFAFSREYYLTIQENWEGLVPSDTPERNWTATTAQTATSFTLQVDASYGNVSAEYIVGESLFVEFTSSPAYNGWYPINSAGFSTQTNVILEFGFNAATITGVGFLGGSQQTSTLQAVLAQKQLLDKGGANMYEYLLREGSEIVSFPFTALTLSAGNVAALSMPSHGQAYATGDQLRITTDDGNYFEFYCEVTSVGINTINVELGAPPIPSGAGVAVADRGKFLTRFTNPKKWIGWNRTVSALVDQELQNRTGFINVRFVFNDTDINKASASFNASFQEGNTPTVITQQIPENIAGPPRDAYMLVRMFDGATVDILSNSLYYRLQDECPEPIMLDWINSKGGVEQWLFTINQEVVYQAGEGIVSERPINSDIEFINRTKQRFPGVNTQRLVLKAEQLTRDQLIALQELKQTDSLRVYLSKDGTNFIDAVVVNSFSTTMQTEENLHRITVQVEFPDDFDFFNGKLY